VCRPMDRYSEGISPGDTILYEQVPSLY
jgi:hypothetical protein